MREKEFYCVKCRKRVMCDADDMCVKFYNNKRTGKTPALRASCEKCDTNLTKFVKRADAERLVDKYGKCR